MDVVIKTKHLSKKYQTHLALHPTNFTLKKGEICALIGKNGAGKSTLIKLIANHIQPTEGTIELFGRVAKPNQEVRKRIGFLIDTSVFITHFTAKQNLEYFATQYGLIDKQRIQDVLDEVGLGQVSKKVKAYSLGMKQRLGIALALLNAPDLIILDEPINGLDVEGIRDFRNLIVQLNKTYGMTVLISSHILSELQQIATQFVFIEKGHLVESVSREALFKKAKKAISLKVDQTSKAVQIIDNTNSDIDYKVLRDETIMIKSDVLEPSEVNALMWEQGIRVYQIKEELFNLENYFLQEQRGESHD
ncbi:ABC transporter ATP-binding protein [Staphylococcus ratti]|uniref:ATP-binding cassette domain-containing protein n=1 Tax=Staphylococcus ratti TaxID=2892440 RepID=A0ABY3PD49_9STAP|nr:ATP-binding cassette domain-containing protein [Staphylococcus ratti]UEX90194.1 ATP-binding cassette domain-containing protein [Staphylococcus ratti]